MERAGKLRHRREARRATRAGASKLVGRPQNEAPLFRKQVAGFCVCTRPTRARRGGTPHAARERSALFWRNDLRRLIRPAVFEIFVGVPLGSLNEFCRLIHQLFKRSCGQSFIIVVHRVHHRKFSSQPVFERHIQKK
jgi:hypothetical protein